MLMFVGYFATDARIMREIKARYANLKLRFYCKFVQLTNMAVDREQEPLTCMRLVNVQYQNTSIQICTLYRKTLFSYYNKP